MASTSKPSKSSSKSSFRMHNDIFKSKLKAEMYVDFETTRDRESREILRLLEASQLRGFCSLRSKQNKTLDLLGAEFLVNYKFTDDDIDTEVDGTQLSYSKDVIARIFNTSAEGVNPLTYKEDEWEQSFEMVAKVTNRGVQRDLKKNLLRRRFRLLMTIVTKSMSLAFV